jgi:hypothetical protein
VQSSQHDDRMTVQRAVLSSQDCSAVKRSAVKRMTVQCSAVQCIVVKGNQQDDSVVQ